VQSQHIVKNRILRQLSADELKSIQPWLMPKQLQPNVVLHEQGAAIDHIYFPLSGMISLLAVMQSGEAIETGIIGAEARALLRSRVSASGPHDARRLASTSMVPLPAKHWP
jgi:CRP-like cAMP-binding protein